MAKVFKIKQKDRNGEYYKSKNYYFKAKIGKTRKNINTNTSNKREAEKIAAQYEQDQILPSFTIATSNSLAQIIKDNGWTDWETNPKKIEAKKENKNYGITQAKKIASTFNYLLDKKDVLDDWEKFIKENRLLKTARFEYFTDFLFNLNASELSKTNASEFTTFLKEYTSSLKERRLRSDNLYFVPNYRMCVIAFRAFFTYSVKKDILQKNIFKEEQIPKPNQKTEYFRNYFSMDELRILFDDEFAKSIDEKFYNSPYFRFLKFLALTGMRSGEARALRYKQFHKKNKNVLNINSAFKTNDTDEKNIGLPKWGKLRSIYLCDSALETVGEFKEDDDFVFAFEDGTPLRAERISVVFNNYLKKVEERYNKYDETFIDGRKITPHSLRRGLNSILLGYKSGDVYLREYWIQLYFGWTNTVLTTVQKNSYTIPTVLSVFYVADAIERKFTGNRMIINLEVDEEKGRRKISNKVMRLE